MDDKVKEKWIKALRSNRYKQTNSLLRRQPPTYDASKKPSYCCLGVLCQTLRIPYTPADGAYVFKYDGDGEKVEILEQGTIPGQVASELGLLKKVTNDGKRVTLQDKLIKLNDDEDWSFEQIANYLERVKI